MNFSSSRTASSSSTISMLLAMAENVSIKSGEMPIEVTDMHLKRLAHEIEAGLYSVPAEKVAEAILTWINPTGLGAARRDHGAPGPSPSSWAPRRQDGH